MDNATESTKPTSLPDAKYFERAIEQVGHFDRLMVALFSGLIAGIVLLLLREQVSPWVGGFLFVSLGLFVMGVGHTLLHMTFHHNMLLALESLERGVPSVPNVIEGEEPTIGAYARMQRSAQTAYSGQFLYLLLGVGFAAVAVVIRLWTYSSRGGVVLAVVATLVVASVSAFRVWRRDILERSKG